TVHASDLVTWTKASGGWGFGGSNPDMMDAMSSATIRTHQMHTVTWNMQNAMKQVVPDGEYVCKIEMTESRARDRMGPVISIKFTKGAAPQMVDGPTDPAIKGATLKYMP
ncbi:MAG TPA: hypothetical protein VJR89_30190, partial [Polyangiales bacterium]|nr:hypothetical protein [Polyangiales bacterium]